MGEHERLEPIGAASRKEVFHPTRLWTARFLLVGRRSQEALDVLGATVPVELEPRLTLYWRHLAADANTQSGDHRAAQQQFRAGFALDVTSRPSVESAFFAGYAESTRILLGLDDQTIQIAQDIINDIHRQKVVIDPRTHTVAYALNRTLALNNPLGPDAQAFAKAAQESHARSCAERIDLLPDEAMARMAQGEMPSTDEYAHSPMLSTVIDPISS